MAKTKHKGLHTNHIVIILGEGVLYLLSHSDRELGFKGGVSWQSKDRTSFFLVNLLKHTTMAETLLEMKEYRTHSALFDFTGNLLTPKTMNTTNEILISHI